MYVRFFFLALAALAWLVSLAVIVRPLRLSRGWKMLLAGALLVASQKFVFFQVFGGSTFTPELPAPLIVGMSWAYSAFMFTTVFACLFALVHAAYRWLSHRSCGTAAAASSVAVVRRRTFVAGLLASGTAAWGLWEGVRVPDVRRRDIGVDDLPPAFDGLRIVHLSDLHCGAAARREHIQGIVERVNALEADLVCITGDFVDGSVQLHATDLEPLAELKAKLGVFGCPGNHEYYANYAAWRPVFTRLGVRMLDNAHHVFTRGDAMLALGGIVDPVAYGRPSRVRRGNVDDVEQAFRGAPLTACRLLLAHRPIDVARHAAQDVRLQLSGHTHGGAYRGMDVLVARANEGHVRGLYREGKLALYVSPGTGQWAGFPLRLGVPAEIAELVLRVRADVI